MDTIRKSNRIFAPDSDDYHKFVESVVSDSFPSGLPGRHAYVGACAINDSEPSIMKTGRA